MEGVPEFSGLRNVTCSSLAGLMGCAPVKDLCVFLSSNDA